MSKPHKYGCLKDRKDDRDFIYQTPRRFLKALPSSITFADAMSDAYNQESLGSCGAQAGALMIQHQRKRLRKVDFTPSRLLLYYQARVYEGTVNHDAGCQLRDIVKAATEKGVCPESMWPYEIQYYADNPSKPCWEEAEKWQVLSYTRVNQTLDQMRGCLAHIGPFIIGLQIYESFESESVAETGIVPMPKVGWSWFRFGGEKLLGGHALTVIGYDDLSQKFLIQNSWGQRWGKDGRCQVPYEYLLSPKLAADAWVVQTVE